MQGHKEYSLLGIKTKEYMYPASSLKGL